MDNGSAIFHNDMLMSSEWPSFLAKLAQSRHGQPIEIEQDGSLLLQHSPGRPALLQGIELRAGHKQQALVIITTAQTHTIESPNLIWAVRNEPGALVAVEILDTQERKFIMRFVSEE
jgi:hypothetical protein